MSGLLEQLRSKKPETRKRFAFGISTSVTGVIFIMWLTVFNHGLLSLDSDIQDISTSNSQNASPLSAFSDNAASAFRQLRSGFSSSETVTTTTVSETLDESRISGSSTNNSLDTYWPNRSSEENYNPTSTSFNESTEFGANHNESKEPFTSRNYNPNQEGEWFSQ